MNEFDALQLAIDIATKHGKHNQKTHGRRGSVSPESLRGKWMKTGADGIGLRRDKKKRVINPDATGGYLAGIPEVVEFEGFRYTPEQSMWHHLEKDPDRPGKYRITEARMKVYNQIVNAALEGVPASNNPTLFMLGGGPASGKSTAIDAGVADVPSKKTRDAVQINADTFKEQLPEYARMSDANNRSPNDFFNAASFTHCESSILVDMIQQRAIDGRKNIVIDGTGDSTIDVLSMRVQRAKENGYSVAATYLTVPTDEAWNRSKKRAIKEGRYVPEAVVRGTHREVSRIFGEAVSRGLFDTTSLIDGTIQGNPRLIGSGTGKNFSVADQELFDAFSAKANE
jgi:predicted ABC-type ATPase